MKKLDDIPKKQVFTTPEGYFDKLPGVIQSRIDAGRKERWHFSWTGSLKYALPAMVIVVALVFWLQPPAKNIAEQLSMIDADQIALYLDEVDGPIAIGPEELESELKWSKTDLDELERDVYFHMDDSEMDDLLENVELDNL